MGSSGRVSSSTTWCAAVVRGIRHNAASSGEACRREPRGCCRHGRVGMPPSHALAALGQTARFWRPVEHIEERYVRASLQTGCRGCLDVPTPSENECRWASGVLVSEAGRGSTYLRMPPAVRRGPMVCARTCKAPARRAADALVRRSRIASVVELCHSLSRQIGSAAFLYSCMLNVVPV